MKLTEAFRALNALNEDTFSVADDGISKLAEFEQNDDLADDISVIDPEAETEEDLQDSYVGKIILDCTVCHSKLYKDIEEVEVDDDDGTVANVGEECPYCYTSDGFKVLGQVSAFGGKTEESEEDTDDTDKANDTDSDDAKDDIVEESLNEAVATLERPMSAIGGTLSNVMADHSDELANVYDKASAIAFLDSIEPEVKNKGYLNTIKEKISKLPDSRATQFLYNIILKGDGMGAKLESVDEGLFDFGYRKRKKECDRRNAERAAQLDKEYAEKHKKWLADYEAEQREQDARSKQVQRSLDQYDAAKRRNSSNGGTGGNTGKAGIHYSGGDYYSEGLNESIEDVKVIKDCIKSRLTGKNDGGGQNSAYFASWLAEDCGVGYEKVAEVAFLLGYDVYKTASGYFGDADYLVVMPGVDPDIYLTDLDDNTQADWANFKDELTKVESFSSALKESVNNVNVETDDSIVNVNTDDSGKVTVTTEPKDGQLDVKDGAEVITPLTDDNEAAILGNTTDDMIDEPVDEYSDVELDEFDDETFDGLGESYLKKVYENVQAYKTTDCSMKDDKIMLEGVITFNSGAKKKTSFIFEAKDFTKSGKYRFIGENAQLTRGKKAFTLKGRIDEGKFITESFNYNYKAKDTQGNSTRIYGTIKG